MLIGYCDGKDPILLFFVSVHLSYSEPISSIGGCWCQKQARRESKLDVNDGINAIEQEES